MIKSLSASILAGGKSSRFGSDKSFYKFGKKTLLEHSVDLAKKVCDNNFIIGNSFESNEFNGLKIFPDIYKNCGPMGGIHTALSKSDTEFVAILPVDLPLMEPEIYKLLFEHISNNNAVVSVSEKGIEPLVSIWPSSFKVYFETLLKQNKYSILEIIKHFDVKKINIKENTSSYNPDWFHNINTREDLDSLNH